ncbi:DUF2325 domain-containing protein [Bacillus sp. EB106-08-02-XG196]|jgi:hypothetical protein|uniref:DUF2325 domain-containing protein n=1 Tax=Bacillus sp. EB106-08-02-XG196 TaxID=2737049 RepID=UPI0015C44F87|nr:DUF2325 domain-containing protein [Bacillus sp. EB106-08-02-XG196]NWQ43683.1 DUF2325 domain-containing protein [Bacillus sp. EB106-08-02-XG196]
MTSLLIIGADHLGVIRDKLTSVGFDVVLHINGRKVQMVKKEIPEKINCILVLTDYVNHNLSTVIKKRAKNQCIPIYYAKRSWCSIYNALKGCK